ncbi:hypothetical protein I3760_12G026400 [Carya illinoinensis]|nr:hypothetical protein I3760_12G026400 [Carya illinoinensis]
MENINADQCLSSPSQIRNVNPSSGGSATSKPNTSSEQELHEQVGQTGMEDSDSKTISDQEGSLSSCESGVSAAISKHSPVFDDGLLRLVEGERVYDGIKRRLVLGFASRGVHVTVVGIHRNGFGGVRGQAISSSFRIYSKAMEEKFGPGNANIKYAWYGASKDEIAHIVSHGFCHCGISRNNGLFVGGVCLSPDDSPLESACNSVVDEDGLRYLLLCRVILGKTELVQIGSEQCHPSSEEFHSGVDNLAAPGKYIVWSTNMNTHILPEFVVSFRAPSCLAGMPKPQRIPTSTWMPFTILISELPKFLPPHTVSELSKYYEAFKEKKISRNEFIQILRHKAGDELLTSVIKSYRAEVPLLSLNWFFFGVNNVKKLGM